MDNVLISQLKQDSKQKYFFQSFEFYFVYLKNGSIFVFDNNTIMHNVNCGLN